MKLYQIILCGATLMISSCGQSKNNNSVNNETTDVANLQQYIVKEINEGREALDLNKFYWINQPKQFSIEDGKLVLTTEEILHLPSRLITADRAHSMTSADLSSIWIVTTGLRLR